MTRKEHLAWCKQRALTELTHSGVSAAVASILSDLGKHPETALPSESPLLALAMLTAMRGDIAETRRFIEGFN